MKAKEHLITVPLNAPFVEEFDFTLHRRIKHSRRAKRNKMVYNITIDRVFVVPSFYKGSAWLNSHKEAVEWANRELRKLYKQYSVPLKKRIYLEEK